MCTCFPWARIFKELIHTSSAQSQQFQSSHHTRSQHIVSSMDHIATLVASLEEGNPIPVSLSFILYCCLFYCRIFAWQYVTCCQVMTRIYGYINVSEDRSNHDELIALGPCSDDSFISPADEHHLGFEASFLGSYYPLDIDSIPLVDKNNSLTIDDLGCADVLIYDLNGNINLCVGTSNANLHNNNAFTCVEFTPLHDCLCLLSITLLVFIIFHLIMA